MSPGFKPLVRNLRAFCASASSTTSFSSGRRFFFVVLVPIKITTGGWPSSIGMMQSFLWSWINSPVRRNKEKASTNSQPIRVWRKVKAWPARAKRSSGVNGVALHGSSIWRQALTKRHAHGSLCLACGRLYCIPAITYEASDLGAPASHRYST